jgi:rhodanese-related sulfurtransferase
VYCQSGARSARASAFMSQNGFASVFNLIGGIGGWRGEVVTK